MAIDYMHPPQASPQLRIIVFALALCLVSILSTNTTWGMAAPAPAGPVQLRPPDSAGLLVDLGDTGLEDFALLSPDEGWVLLGQKLYWTRTSGEAWISITPSNLGQQVIRSVSFLDTRHGWLILEGLAAESGATFYSIARTSDRGSTWQVHAISTMAPDIVKSAAAAIYMYWLDTRTGWVVLRRTTGSNFRTGILFKTTDGGDTWSRLSIPVGEPVYFVTPEIGWIAGGPAGDQLYRTSDGGASWQPQAVGRDSNDKSSPLYQLPRFHNSQDGSLPIFISMGDDARLELYATHDRGESWRLAARVPLGHRIESGVSPPLANSAADKWTLVSPRGRRILHLTLDGQVTSTASLDPQLDGIGFLAMASANVGWAKHLSGECVPLNQPGAASTLKRPMRCTQSTRLLRTTNGGVTWQALALPKNDSPSLPFLAQPELSSRSSPAAVTTTPVSNTQMLAGQGFDKCEVASLSALQTWWDYSPYGAVNLYIGGSSRACSNSALTATYISQIAQKGWKFIPTWVGLQAACTSYKSRMSSDPAISYSQGITEANAAVDTANALGLSGTGLSGTIIFFDLEAYDTSNTSCRTAADSFISGWSGQLRNRGALAGVYGASCASAPSDWANIPNVPDILWLANWLLPYQYRANASVWGAACLSDTLWVNHQRLRQYAGGHTESWGGTTLIVDSDVIDGIVVNLNNGLAPLVPAIPNPAEGAVISRTTDITLYWKTDGSSCDVTVSGGGVALSPTGGSCASFHLGSLYGGAYQWQVSSHNTFTFTTGPLWHFMVQPYAPTNVAAKAKSRTQITLSWTPSADDPGNVDDYRIYFGDSTFIAQLPAGSTAQDISALQCGTNYSFYATAVRQGVESTASNIASAMTLPCPLYLPFIVR